MPPHHPDRTRPEPPYAAAFADRYDDWFAAHAATDATVEFLVSLAKDAPHGPFLELGSGTGRVAIPLASLGYAVHGIDASAEMTARLHAKAGGADIPVTLGDFSAPPDAAERGRHSVVYAAGGTFAELTTQEAQRRCFRSAAQHLLPGGLFVLDAHLPEALATVSNGTQPVDARNTDFVLRTRALHPATQTYTSDYVVLDDGRLRHARVTFRYASPGELDLMAEAAGLRLRRRCGGWSGAPFKDTSTYHVSVYELPA